jgi:hypothetical protein
MESSIKKRINWYLGSNVIKKIKVSFNKNNWRIKVFMIEFKLYRKYRKGGRNVF